jgi:hypothetical protein
LGGGMIKRCFKCNKEKDLDDFYKHPQMKDGRVNKCKECAKTENIDNRKVKIEYYKDFDKKRNQDLNRKKYCARKSKKWRLNNPEKSAEIKSNWKKRNPLKYKAHSAVSNALKNGLIKKKPCEICGDKKSESHHPDYSKPLDIIWLCDFHHKEEHREKEEVPHEDSTSI